MGIRITERDRVLFYWINGHGFANANQVSRKLGVVINTAYIRLKKLIDAGLLERKEMFKGEQGVFQVTKNGVAACGYGLSLLKNIGLGTYYHDLKLIDLSLNLEKENNATFIPERRIRQDMGSLNIKDHVPDGMLVFEDGKMISIELELSLKSKERINKIMVSYAGNFGIKEVWYYVGSVSIQKAIQKAAEKRGASHVKILGLLN